MKVPPSLSFFAMHGDYSPCLLLTPCRISENVTGQENLQVRDFSSLPSSLNLASSFPPTLSTCDWITRTKLVLCCKQLCYFNPLGLKCNKMVSDLEDSLQFWESWWQSHVVYLNEGTGVLWWLVEDFDVNEYVGCGCLQNVVSWSETMNINT